MTTPTRVHHTTPNGTRQAIVGSLLGAALSGIVAWAIYRIVNPLLEASDSPIRELQGFLSTAVMLLTAAGLAGGCWLALRREGHAQASTTAILTLVGTAVLAPFAFAAQRFGWPAGATAMACSIALAAALARRLSIHPSAQ